MPAAAWITRSFPTAPGSNTTACASKTRATGAGRRCGHNIVEDDRARQLARHRVQRLGTRLPMLRDARLQAHARGQVADDQAHGQHHGKGQQVLRIGDREAVVRRHEQEVEQRNRQQRCDDRRPAPEAIGRRPARRADRPSPGSSLRSGRTAPTPARSRMRRRATAAAYPGQRCLRDCGLDSSMPRWALVRAS